MQACNPRLHLLRRVPVVARVVHRLDVQEHEVVAPADQRVGHRRSLGVELGPVVAGRARNLRPAVHDMSCGMMLGRRWATSRTARNRCGLRRVLWESQGSCTISMEVMLAA